jgi:hypothetical protein
MQCQPHQSNAHGRARSRLLLSSNFNFTPALKFLSPRIDGRLSSPAGVAATGVGAQLRNLCFALEHQPESIRGGVAMRQYSDNFSGALDSHAKFNRAALAALRQTWLDRFRRRRRSLPKSAD